MYSFGRMVACFRYASIDVHSVYLPPSKLEFYYNDLDWIQKEVNEVLGKKYIFLCFTAAGCKLIMLIGSLVMSTGT